jgi:hypothetical protein
VSVEGVKGLVPTSRLLRIVSYESSDTFLGTGDYAQDEDFVTLFRREAEPGSLLNHSNIVQELDVGRFQEPTSW